MFRPKAPKHCTDPTPAQVGVPSCVSSHSLLLPEWATVTCLIVTLISLCLFCFSTRTIFLHIVHSQAAANMSLTTTTQRWVWSVIASEIPMSVQLLYLFKLYCTPPPLSQERKGGVFTGMFKKAFKPAEHTAPAQVTILSLYCNLLMAVTILTLYATCTR